MDQEALDYRQLGEDSDELIIAFDTDFRYTYVNPQVELLLGASRDTILGRTIWEVAPHMEGTAYAENYRRAMRERVVLEFEAYYPPLNRWNQVRCVPESHGGLIVFARNITEQRLADAARDEAIEALKLSEAQARRAAHVLDTISEAYVTVDRDFRILYVNAEAARINKKPAVEFIGRLHWDEWPASVGTEFDRQFRRAMRDRVSVRFLERYYVPGIYDDWIEVSVYPASEEDGGGLHLVYSDVSERVHRERREKFLAELAERARSIPGAEEVIADAVRSVGEFLGVARCTYADIDLIADTVTVHPDYCNEGVSSIAGVLPLSAFGPYLTREFEAGRAVVADDVQADTEKVPTDNLGAYESIGIRAHVTVPLVHSSRLVSTIALHSVTPRKWQVEEVDLARTVLERTWLTVEVIRKQVALQEEMEERRRQGEYLRRVVESSPDCISTLDFEGHILSMNEGGQRVMEIEGLSSVLGTSWLDLWQATPVKETASRALTAAREGSTARFEGFGQTIKGTPKWWNVVVAPLLGAEGKPEQILCVSRDVTEQREAEERERFHVGRERSRLNELFQKTPAFMALLRGPLHVYEMANARYMESIGYRDIMGKPVAEALPEVVDQGFLALMDRVYETGEAFVGKDVRVLLQKNPSGPLEESYIDSTYQPLRDDSGNVYGILAHGIDVTERKRLENEREQLLTEARDHAEREILLSNASRVLSASLDYEATLTAVAQLIVPRFADWCAVDITDEAGTPHRVAIEHVDPEKASWGWELNRRYPTRMGDNRGIAGVLQTGQPSFTPHLTDDMLAAAIPDPERLRLMLEIGFTSVMIVPLAVRENVFGAISLVATRESGRIYTEEDLRFAQEIGQRAGTAVQNARLFRATQQRAERESLLNKIGEAMRSSTDPDAMLRATVAYLGEGLGADRCYFARYNQTRDVARASPEWIRAGAKIHSLAGRDLLMSTFSVNRDSHYRAGATQVVHDVLSLPPEDADPLIGVDMRALLRVPMEVGDAMRALCVSMAFEPRQWTIDEVRLVENVASLLHAALESIRVRQREHKIAEQLQSALFPIEPLPVPGLSLAHFYRPALEEAGVGGDYFEVMKLDEGCSALVVADLSGKGLAAASQVATVRNMLRFALYNSSKLVDAIENLHKTLVTHDLLTGFATLFVGLFDYGERTLTYVNCGQEPTLIWRAASREIERLDPTGPILGSFLGDAFEQKTICLDDGDVIAIFTDGLTEVGPTRKNLLEIDGVSDLLLKSCDRSSNEVTAQSVMESLIARVDDFARGGIGDDIALLVGVVQTSTPQEAANP